MRAVAPPRVAAPRCTRSATPRVAAPRCTASLRAVARRCAPLRAAAGNDAPLSAEDLTPAGCERIKVSIKRPLGIVLEANKKGEIYVVEVSPDGSAARDGRIAPGDQLIATSAVVYTREDDYGGVAVKGGQTVVRLMVRGETFDTVMRAIGTHPGHMPVTLDIQKCKTLKQLQAEQG